MNIYKLVLLLPFFISLDALSQEDKLLIDKGELVWLLGKYEENIVLKKRLILKDNTIELLNNRIDINKSIIESYQRDSVSYSNIIANKNTEISLKDKKIKEEQSNTTKLKVQNVLLKIVVGLLAVLAIFGATL